MSNKLYPETCAVIIINYNNTPDTLNCLRSIYYMRDKPGYVLVVDNASKACERENLLSGWKSICLENKVPVPVSVKIEEPIHANCFLLLDDNRGFGYGNNAGVKFLFDKTDSKKCAAFWFLNNDTEPQSGALAALCHKLNAGYGMAGSTLVYAADRQTCQTAAGGTFLKWLGTTRFILHGKPLYEVLKANEYKIEKKLAYVDAASLLCDRRLCAHPRLFSEDYFLYYEDVDLGISARKNGCKLGWARGSVIYHKCGASRRFLENGLKNSLDALVIRNRMYCLKKHFPMYLFMALPGVAFFIIKRLFASSWSIIKVMSEAVVNGLSGKMSASL